MRHLGIGRQGQRPPRAAGLGGIDRAGEGQMKTDDLITMLATNVESVDHRQLKRTVGMAVMLGTAVAFGTMLLVFGIRADLTAADARIFLLLKLAFTLALLVP